MRVVTHERFVFSLMHLKVKLRLFLMRKLERLVYRVFVFVFAHFAHDKGAHTRRLSPIVSAH